MAAYGELLMATVTPPLAATAQPPGFASATNGGKRETHVSTHESHIR